MEGKEVFDDLAPRGDIVGCASATVPVSGQSEEARMLTRERWEEVHRSRAGGQSVPAIARGLDLEAYLRHVIGRIAEHPVNRVAELLPWNVAAELAPPELQASAA